LVPFSPMGLMHAATATAEQVVGAMEADGYCVVEGLLDEDAETTRVYALFAKTRAFDGVAVHPLVVGVLDRVLGHYQLSAPTGIQIGPGEQAQVLHRDQSVYPLPPDFPSVVVNTMWALDDFTEANGATRIVPGSHRWVDRLPTDGDEVVAATMPAGSVNFYLGRLYHGGGANRTDQPRLGVILEYVSSWLRPQENHLLAVPAEVVAGLPERLQELLGYNIYPPFLGYVDGRHPRRSLPVLDRP
jgi:ectoine hydroxylase-related dioxygenase (phytanoyl-CoA dioxygenase family)